MQTDPLGASSWPAVAWSSGGSPTARAAVLAAALACLPASAAAIVGGQATTGHPEVAALLFDGERLCSGVLVAPRDVVTAAHCVDGLTSDGAGLSVHFADGSQDPAPLGVVAVEAILLHPGFSSPDRIDLAVVALAADAPVAPATWSEAPVDLDLGPLEVTLVGFGVSDEQGGADADGAPPWARRQADVAADDATLTHLLWWDDEVAICSGDSGGAVFLRGTSTLVAVATEGDPDCAEWGAGIRTDVFSAFLADPRDPPAWTGLDDLLGDGWGDGEDDEDGWEDEQGEPADDQPDDGLPFDLGDTAGDEDTHDADLRDGVAWTSAGCAAAPGARPAPAALLAAWLPLLLLALRPGRRRR